jgi:hypothetical protein
MPLALSGADDEQMQMRYGVVWREGTFPPATGALELLPHELRLDGLADSRPTARKIPYDGLVGVRVGRSPRERIDGRPTVILERRTGLPITITTVAQPGAVGEIVERLAALQLGAEGTRRTAIVVPIEEAARDDVRNLLEAGPHSTPRSWQGRRVGHPAPDRDEDEPRESRSSSATPASCSTSSSW